MTPTLDAIARSSGTFAMVAMDQRESLRHMFDLAGRGRPDDDVLIDFKVLLAAMGAPRCSIAEMTSTTSRLLIS